MREGGPVLEFGPFRLDLLRRSLERDGQPIALSGKALEILAILLERRGEVVDKDDLMRQVWPDTAVEENNITVAISALRKALGETASATKWIVTIPGRGYSFAGLAASQPLRSVAILPFSVQDQDGRNEYLGLGLADAVVTRLGNTPLIVRPLASVSRFADQDPLQTGRDLGVDAIVVGRVRTADDLIRVSVHLFRVRDSQLLWAQNFDVTVDHAFTLEDSISERIVSHLSGRLTAEQQSALNRRRTENPSAYTNYLRGRYYAKKYSEDGFRKALAYLQAAIDSDPGYALAHSGLADLFYDASNLVFPPRDIMPRAKAAAQRAVELDPSLAAAHVSLGLIASKYEWDWEAAAREFQAALAIDPNLATAHLWYGTYRAQMGDFNRAIPELQRAQELDPLSGEINAYLGLVLYWARQYDDSINQFRQAITFDPTFVPSYVCFAWVLAASGDTKAALEVCQQAVERQSNAWTMLALARAQALAGDPVIAASTMDSIGKEAPRFVSGYDRAAVHAALGQTEKAFAALEDGYQARAEWMGYLKIDPQMDTLRSDPRYATFLTRLNF
jgi:DNA-binding winged helix-turn-helix (wHTH) protein/TolB-like protein/tetratricopeptide (TPR) repeat protein